MAQVVLHKLNLTAEELDTALEKISYNFNAISDNFTKDEEFKQLVDEKFTTLNNDLASYALKTELPDVSGFATKEDLNSYALKSELPDISGFAAKEDLNSYALKSEIPDVSGFATKEDLASYQVAGDYATKEDLASYQVAGDYATKEDLSAYQPAGDYATKDDLSAYQVAGDYATKDDLSTYQVAGDYATKDDLSAYQVAGDYVTKDDLNSYADIMIDSFFWKNDNKEFEFVISYENKTVINENNWYKVILTNKSYLQSENSNYVFTKLHGFRVLQNGANWKSSGIAFSAVKSNDMGDMTAYFAPIVFVPDLADFYQQKINPTN